MDRPVVDASGQCSLAIAEKGPNLAFGPRLHLPCLFSSEAGHEVAEGGTERENDDYEAGLMILASRQVLASAWPT